MGRVAKNATHQRVINACVRCRRHKIKCSGESPCSNCEYRKATCFFASEEAKVQVTKRRLSELKHRNSELENENIALRELLSTNQSAGNDIAPQVAGPSPVTVGEHSTRTSSPPHSETVETPHPGLENPEMTNPLSTGPPKFVLDVSGNPHYLGHTSNWSLTTQLLDLTHQSLYNCPFPSAGHHIDSMTYNFGWNGLRDVVIPDIRGLPSLDHALFLIKATEFHTGQIFHLFDKDSFLLKLHWFYENPIERINDSGLWFIHFLVIAALGKAFVGSKQTGNSPPGSDLFAKAFVRLPEFCYLWKIPCEAGELMCSMALYLQCIDWRTTAHNMISQAQRILLVHGYHRNISAEGIDNVELRRRETLWWTVFILERQMSVLMGVPLGIRDRDIFTPLPNFPESSMKTETAVIHVKLSKALGRVVDTLYGGASNIASEFLKMTQEVLHGVANVASDIRTHLPIPEPDSMSGISRVTGYMNLLYHECIILSIRPFLFNLVQRCVDSEQNNSTVPIQIKVLLQICLESAKKTIYILEALMSQSLLDCFLPFDLESAVSAGLVFIMAGMVDPALTDLNSHHIQSVFRVLDRMVQEGNLVAAGQKVELIELQNLSARLQSLGRGVKSNEPVQQMLKSQAHSSDVNGLLQMMTDEQLLNIEGDQGLDDYPSQIGSGQYADLVNSTCDVSSTHLMNVVDMLNADDLRGWVMPSIDDCREATTH